jgi:magnesium transporter
VDARTDPTRAPPGDSEAGVIAASVYAGGRRVKDVAIEEAGEWSKRPGHVVWIGLWEPSADLLQRVQAQFALQKMPLRTRRSSTRGMPRDLFGSIGLMTLHS